MHLLNCLKLPPSFFDRYGVLLCCCSMVVDNGAPEAPHAGATGSAMSSEMVVSPSSAASSNHAPFTPSEIPGMTMDVSALDSAFGSDVGNPGSLQLGPDGSSRDSNRSFGQLWNFSLSDLTADLTSLGGKPSGLRNLPYVFLVNQH